MKRIHRSLLISLILTSMIVHASDLEIMVGTNRFQFVFQDTALDQTLRETILDDLSRAIVRWTNSPVVFHDNLSGEIDFRPRFCGQFEGGRHYPSEFSRNTTNDAFRLMVKTSLSNDYMRQLAFLESRTGMVSAISSFVDFLNSDASASLSSEDVPSYLFMTSDFVEHWNHRKNPQQTLHDYWVHEMPQYRFFLPSILDYWVWKSDGDLPADSLSVTIPVQIRNFQPSVFDESPNTGIPASWVDGRWKIHPVVW